VATARAVTRAQRNFGAAELADLDRDQLRPLCHALLLARGASVGGFRALLDFDEYLIVTERLWSRHRSVVRIYERSVEPSDVDELQQLLASENATDGLIMAPQGFTSELSTPPSIGLLGPSELAAIIERSPLAEWHGDRPQLSSGRLASMLTLPEAARLVDPSGIAWLPALALNELPAELEDLDLEPQDVLEQKAFRVLTGSLRFGGERFGNARRGERLPDALVEWRSAPTSRAMVDCKAASSGYQMEADHLLRFQRYYDELSPRLSEDGASVTHLVVISSHFPGRDDSRHPYFGRAREVLELTGMTLAYLRASDLAWLAYDMEAREIPLAARERVDWAAVFDHGLVESQHLREALEAAI